MANKNFIKSVYDQAGGKPRSVEWYRKKIREFTLPSSGQLVREGKRTKRPTPGVLNMFFYDPKTKGKLPYYDTFPLVLPIEEYNNGFLGLNFHYLSIPLRVKLLDKMMDYAGENEINETTRLRVDYRNLKNINLVKPTLKRYLTNHLRSDFRRITADEFLVAALLPVQQFKKASDRKVYADSRSMI